jgi:zinc/manganese transport system permease protein
MLLPLLACLLLAGIHGYLGIHVLSRGVIFVDLAMAQIAALGAAMAVLFNHELDSAMAYSFSISFTMAGALVLSLTDFRKGRVPQEAIIGVVYAVSAAAVILVMQYAPHGAEHIQDLLVGHVLWVNWREVTTEFLVYAPVGALFGVLSSRTHLISADPEEARRRGHNVFFWNFFFYALFGIVVTVSVRLAGVLLVFSFLVVPAIIAFLFADSFGDRILLAWAVGATVSVIGCVLSFKADWPTGATVVVAFGAVLVSAGLFYRLRRRVRSPPVDLAKIPGPESASGEGI